MDKLPNAMQDLHDLKKLRNNCKYLSKRLLIFANPSIISYEERLMYAVRWDGGGGGGGGGLSDKCTYMYAHLYILL